jgi:uncharacterized protein YjiS (DUF1127 family)
MESGEAVHGAAKASAAVFAALRPRDRGSTAISVRSILSRCKAACQLTAERYRQRQQLMEMDYRQLKDIGITLEQAHEEARKPIWKA